MRWEIFTTIAWLVCWPSVGLAAIDFPPELAGSEITQVLGASDALPMQLEAMREIADIHGPVTETLIPFSDTPLHTNLEEPRIVVSSTPKFFYAAIARLDGRVDFEFMSWNRRSGKYDFGLVSDFGQPSARIALAETKNCHQCHRTGGPIFTDRPWTNVNGANSPIGTMLSLAMLSKLVERDPRKYARYESLLKSPPDLVYDPVFGNLTPEPAIALGPLRLHGTPLFSLRGSFDLDANTRRGHYLMQSHEILRTLPPQAGLAFARGLVEGALAGVAHPDEIEHLFSWNDYLDEWVKKQEGLKTLPSSLSPILKNYQPLFDNVPLCRQAGINDKLRDQNPIEALVKLSDYVKANDLSTYPPDELPSSGKPFIEFKPNHNGGADTALWLLTNLEEPDFESIRTRAAAIGGVRELFNTAKWDALWTQAAFPSREEVLNALGVSVPTLSDPSLLGQRVILQIPKPSFTQELRHGHKCLTCHGGPPDGTAMIFPFDPLDTDEWDRRFNSDFMAESSRVWAKRILSRIQDQSMPLAGSDESKGFFPLQGEWKQLVEMLKKRVGSQ